VTLEITMKLLPGEATISSSIDGLTLTTHRVRDDQTASGSRQVISITLDAVSSCGIVSKSYPILLLLAVLSGGFGLLRLSKEEQSLTYAPILLALVLVLAYFLTRSVVLAISSPGQSISISAKGMEPDTLIAFVDEVEQAKLHYLGKLVEEQIARMAPQRA